MLQPPDRLEDEGYCPILREAGLYPEVPDEAVRGPVGPAGSDLDPVPAEVAR